MQVVLKALLAYLNPFSSKIVPFTIKIVPFIKSVHFSFENGNNYCNVLILQNRIFLYRIGYLPRFPVTESC